MAYIPSVKEIARGFERDMVKALTTLGYYAMMDAYRKRSFRHRTRNLHDSYASAVYINGVLDESSIRYVGGVLSKVKDPKTRKTGRETVNDYLRSHKFGKTNNEIVLIVIAAMYYSGILENKYHYVVISPAREYIDSHWGEATAKVYAKYGIKEKPRARVIKGERL
jgi:hypothetical protein